MSTTSNRPSQPVTGQPVEDGYDSMLWLWVFSLEIAIHALAARLEYLIKRVAGGAGGSANSQTAIPYKVVSGTTATGYAINVYAKGLGEASTGTGTLVVPTLALGSDLPAGYIGWALPSELAITGGND